MYTVLANFGLAFIEGFALIISPCILPILPIILVGSLTGNKSRPLGIIIGFILTFTIITLFARALIQLTHIDQEMLRNASFAILFLLGVIMISTYLTEKFNRMTQRLSQVGSSFKNVNDVESGFWGGVLFGCLVGIIWTPCAGPILAAVIVQAIVQKTTIDSILTVVAFAIGVGVPMLLIALLGRKILNRFPFFRNQAVFLRKLLGYIIIITVFFLVFDTGFSLFPSNTNKLNANAGQTLINGVEPPYPSPKIAGIDAWINSPPLTIEALKGKVVLVDFWTYSCINCIRTFPYIKDWYEKYHDKGLEIIGIHSPEFEFERNLDNVKAAVAKFGIRYPVALDNNFVTWQNFENRYWPAHYLINKEGEVVYEHYGEGAYDVTENNIRFLLGLSPDVASPVAPRHYTAQTPETYLGYARSENTSLSSAILKDLSQVYVYPETLPLHYWSLNGKWTINRDKIVSGEAGAAIKLHFQARKVYAVMGVQKGMIKIKLLLNGSPLENDPDNDVQHSQMEVGRNQLYTLVNLKEGNTGTLEIIASQPGLEIYTFTFGD